MAFIDANGQWPANCPVPTLLTGLSMILIGALVTDDAVVHCPTTSLPVLHAIVSRTVEK